MNVQLIVAGCLAVVGAGIHGVLGDLLVVRRLSLETLPATRFGGRRATKSMIHVTWELTTLSFLMVGPRCCSQARPSTGTRPTWWD